MESAIRMKARVLPGNRIEITAPELKEGEDIDVLLLIPAEATRQESVVAFLDSLPQGPRRPQSWQEIDATFNAERDAWDR